jgi:predicted dinucleotide-binding enzyme
MKIGILGTGDVGRALARGFLACGHEVTMGARQAGNEKAAAWAKEGGLRASAGTFADAARFGEVVVVATLGVANEAVLAQAGPDHLKGKVVIDATNPLDSSKGFPPTLAISGRDSGGEQVQRLVPGARVVKCFNIVTNAHMYKPDFPGGPPDMFIAGNDASAKQQVTKILADFGWNSIDLGGIEASRYLEAMCMAYVLHAVGGGGWNLAWKMLRK